MMASKVMQTTFFDLCCAAYAGDLTRCKELAGQGVNIKQRVTSRMNLPFDKSGLNHVLKKNASLLNIAASSGHRDVCQFFLDLGLSINVNGFQQSSPLIDAAYEGFAEVCQYLLDRGANVDATDKDKRTALNWAARRNNFSTVKVLVAAKSNIEHLDKFGCSALIRAAQGSAIDVTHLLIEQSASLMLADRDGNTALHYAALKGATEVCSALISAGAKVDCVNKSGNTPLHLACHNGKLDICQKLLHAGADPNKSNNELHTALHEIASRDYHIEDQIRASMAHELLMHDANPNARAASNCTPLHLAASQGHSQLCMALMKGGADSSMISKGVTPAGAAGKSGHKNLSNEIKAYKHSLEATRTIRDHLSRQRFSLE